MLNIDIFYPCNFFTMKKLTLAKLALGIAALVFHTFCIASEPTVVFSHERGFYYSSFDLLLDAGTAGCMIRYTLDGADPRHSADAVQSESPVSLAINPYINQGRAITPAVVVRACAICNSDTGIVETHTYIFPSEVKFQPDISPDLEPYWPGETYITNWNPPNLLDWMQTDYQIVDLECDPSVISRSEYYSGFEDDLLDIPTLSLATDPSSLWSADSGIYRNATWSGMDWEREGSIELIDPSADGFQSNTGIRIRGGWSCRGDFGKHAFRLFFRTEYGNGKLNYPLFGDEGTDKFDKIDLRCDANNGWQMPGGNPNADYVHELFARDIQGDMQQPYTRSRYYHLFVNGMYWGLYDTQERPEASYAETYLGGKKEDYDVVKSSGPSYDYPPYTLEATDGDLNSSYEFWQIAKEGFTLVNYNKVKGLNPDGSPNPSYKKYLDEDNLIDYMIIIYFSGDFDGPAEFGGGTRINNFFAIFNRENPDGFKYMCHDMETTFGSYSDNNTNLTTRAGNNFSGFNPNWLHQKLLVNAEYRQKFADRAYKYLYNNGVLTIDKNIERFHNRVDQCEKAIVGESARWGDGYALGAPPYTRDQNWEPVIQYFYNSYFPHRTDIVIDQFSSMGWFNGVLPPTFDESDFEIDESNIYADHGSFKLINPNASGEIYYTVNGWDPRQIGGAISPEAIQYSNEITVDHTIFLNARIKDGDNWSPMIERVVLSNPVTGLIISEISYDPKDMIVDGDTLPEKSLEFVEIKNTSSSDIELTGYRLEGGIQYTFPPTKWIKADSLYVIASDNQAFAKLYGFEPLGQFEGSLNNSGDNLVLSNPCGGKCAEVEFNKGGTWYKAADGVGFTLVYETYDVNQYDGIKENWRPSTNWLGSPGEDDPEPENSTVSMNEILANSGHPLVDAIELFNSSATDVNIGGWFLSDEKNNPTKWKIPDGTLITGGGYLAFYEGHYVGQDLQYSPGEFGSAFSLSSGGETIYLCSSDGLNNPQHFVSEYAFDATDLNTSFGLYTNSVQKINNVLLDTLTLGSENSSFRPSPLLFKTIMYHPAGNNFEFLVLKNRSDSVLNLYLSSDSSITWKIDGIGFNFPANVSINPGDSLYLVEKRVTIDDFRDAMNIDPQVNIFNYSGQLKNSSELISIMKPVTVENDTVNPYAWVSLEQVEYEDDIPWPSSADGDGYALKRKNELAFANDYTNWKAVLNTLPDANAGIDKRIRVHSTIQLDGSDSFDPKGNPLTFQWNILEKPSGSTAQLLNATQMMPEFTPDQLGTFRLSLQVSNGTQQSAPSYVSVYSYANRTPVAYVTRNSIRVQINDTAVLNGSRSYDPDYEDLTYDWDLNAQPDGSTAQMESLNSSITSLIPDVEGRYDVYLTVDDGESSSTYHVVVTATPAVGIPDIPLTDNVMVYPNPASSNINIEFMLAGNTQMIISLSEIDGREIYRKDYSELMAGMQHFNINFNELNAEEGLYILKVQTTQATFTRKILFID
jgi:hypothetical protein